MTFKLLRRKFLDAVPLCLAIWGLAVTDASGSNGEADPARTATTDLALAEAAIQRANPAMALERSTRAFHSARLAGRGDLQRRSLEIQGDSFFFLGQPEDAVVAYSSALDLLTERDEPGTEAAVRKSLGIALRETGRFEEALDYLEEARRLATKSEDWRVLGSVLGNLASVYSRLEAIHLAETMCRRLLDLAIRHGEDALALDARARLGQLYLNADSPTRAQVELEAALEIAERGDNQSERVWILEMLGDGALMLGEYDRACEIFRLTSAHHMTEGPPFRRVGSLVGLGACLERSDPGGAADAFEEADRQSRGNSWSAAAGMGRLFRAAGDLDRAVEAFERSLTRIQRERRAAPGHASRQSLCVKLVASTTTSSRRCWTAMLPATESAPSKSLNAHGPKGERSAGGNLDMARAALRPRPPRRFWMRKWRTHTPGTSSGRVSKSSGAPSGRLVGVPSSIRLPSRLGLAATPSRVPPAGALPPHGPTRFRLPSGPAALFRHRARSRAFEARVDGRELPGPRTARQPSLAPPGPAALRSTGGAMVARFRGPRRASDRRARRSAELPSFRSPAD